MLLHITFTFTPSELTAAIMAPAMPNAIKAYYGGGTFLCGQEAANVSLWNETAHRTYPALATC